MPAESLPQVLSIFADLVQRPHLPEDQLEDARLGCLQEVKAIEDDLAQKTMQQLRLIALCRAVGTQLARHRSHRQQTDDRPTCGGIFEQLYSPRDAILSVAGKIDWPRLKADVEQLLGDWQAGR